MTTLCYLGDEPTAAGFRLTGMHVVVPETGHETEALATARMHASLVLLAASVAARIPRSALQDAQAALAPLTLIVPDLRDQLQTPDIASRLRGQLGIEGAR